MANNTLFKTEAEYRRALRAAVRGLWTGALDEFQFFDAMMAAIEFGMRKAFLAGAKECGITADDLTQEEQIRILTAISYERQWIDGLADTVIENSKANKGKLTPLFTRLEIWIGRYEGFKSEAQAMACADLKLKWILGRVEQSCGSCLRLNGKVKRGSFWKASGILPRVHGAPYLECKGFRCDCTLEPTDEPVSRGPLPRLP